VLYYSEAVTKVLESPRSASSDNIAAARGEVEKLTADGGTDINSALASAAQMFMMPNKGDTAGRPHYAIFLTDGQPTVGEVSVDKIISNAKDSFPDNVKLFVFGVGNDVNTTLLDSLSYAHHGSASYVSEQEDIEVKVSQFYAKMSSPALTNLSISIDGLEERDMMPRELPDLFHNTELFITGRYGGHPADAVKLSVSGKGEGGVDKTLSATISSNVSSGNNQVPRLWAARKVSWLLDQLRLRGDNQELLSEVDRLATRFGIITPYTSYLITEPGMYFDIASRLGDLEGTVAEAREDEAGAAAVGRSKQSQVNQDAVNAAAPQSAGQAAGGAGGNADYQPPVAYDAAEVEAKDKLRRKGNADPFQAVNYVNEQTFVRQDLPDMRIQWVDARIDTAQNARRVKLTTYSDAYFKLIGDHPELADYLSQGESVVLWLSDSLVLETTVEEVSTPQSDIDDIEKALQ
jgi:Ca-activated chloride channel family protein